MATRISDSRSGQQHLDGRCRSSWSDEAERFGKELADDKTCERPNPRRIRHGAADSGIMGQKQDAQDGQKQLRKVLLLKPRLAYQARRASRVRPLADVLTDAIDLVAKADDADEQNPALRLLCGSV